MTVPAWCTYDRGGGHSTFLVGCVPHGFQKVGSRERIFLEGSWKRKFASWELKFWPKQDWKCIFFSKNWKGGALWRIDGKFRLGSADWPDKKGSWPPHILRYHFPMWVPPGLMTCNHVLNTISYYSENVSLSEKISWGNFHPNILLLRKKSFYPSRGGPPIELSGRHYRIVVCWDTRTCPV